MMNSATMALRFGAAALLLVLAPSCDEETIDHPAQVSADEADFPLQVATAYCDSLFACGGAQACGAATEFPYDTVAACVEHERALLEEVSANATAAGMQYDPACAEQVIAAYGDLECLGYRQLSVDAAHLAGPMGTACQPYYVETPADSGTCIQTAGTRLNNCEPGQHCLDSSCADVEDLSPCHDACPEGTSCTDNVTASRGSGLGGECRDIVALGETCYGADSDFICESGSYCRRDADDEGNPIEATCQARGELGAACETDAECNSYSCIDGTCVTEPPVLCDYAPHRWR